MTGADREIESGSGLPGRKAFIGEWGVQAGLVSCV